MKLYPLLFEPMYFEKIWGGNKIAKRFQRNLNSANIGESWELISNNSYSSRVTNGSLYGSKLSDLFCEEIMGSEVLSRYNYFPLLIKYIDANDDLSVQVHPSQQSGAKQTKNEIWFFLDAPESEEIICGVENDFDIHSIKHALCRMKINKGDSVFIPSGAVHAITKGSFVLEIQEPADITYRLYDWDRTNPDGTTRELHVGDALSNTVKEYSMKDFICPLQPIHADDHAEVYGIKECEHFALEKWVVKKQLKQNSYGNKFSVLNVLSGTPAIESYDNKIILIPGDTVLIPAQLGEYVVYGQCEIIHSRV